MTAHRRDVAFIYHYDLDAALNGESVDWQIIPVNLDAGRIGGDLCRQAADFPKRWELFAPAVAAPDADDRQPTPASTAPEAGVANRPLRGIRYDAWTNEVTEVDLKWELRERDGKQWLHILNGPTGYESAPLRDLLDKCINEPEWLGWNACAGTPKRWDRLVVTAQSLRDVFATRQPSTTSSRPSASPTAQMVAAANERRDALRERRRRMRESAIKTGRLAEFDAAWQAAGITKDSSDDEVQAALDAIEPPFDPQETPCSATTSTSEVSSRSNWRKPADSPTTTTSGSSGSTSSIDSARSPETSGRPIPSPTSSSDSTTSTTSSKPDSGGPLDERDLTALLDAVTKSEARAVVNGWLRQGNAAGCSWDPRTHPDVRHFEITRAALALAVATDGDDDVAWTVVRLALGGGLVTLVNMPFGQFLSDLTIDEAKRVTAIAEAFGITLSLRYTDDGQPVIEGDVAGVLERAA